MRNRLLTAFLALLIAGAAHAHFTFVVPHQGGSIAKVFLSENIIPDASVDVGLIADSKLWLRDASGKEHRLTLSRDGGVFTTPLPGGGNRVIHGLTDLGLMNRGKAHLLLYYPKTIIGDAFDPKSRVGGDAVAELIPVGAPGDFKLLLLGRGKPLADAEITVLQPDGSEEVFTTDSTGHTQSFTQKGRHSAWARYWEDAPGDRDGEKYEQLRHYATLVFDTAEPEHSSAPSVSAKQVDTLPEATSSFGSAVADGWLYIYGGHIAPTHVYSTEAVSGRFHRMRVDGQGGWEELPSGPGLQGMNIAAHNGMIYRIGGMAPRNSPDQPTDNRSVAENARFNPKTMQWEELPPLPEPRSSHDVVVLDDQLLVVGGWTMQEGDEAWAETTLTMDLTKKPKKMRWNSIPTPFRRRALMAAAYDDKMYVVGGFTDDNQVQRTVSIYDPQTQQWSEGPELPEGNPTAGFAPAVGVHAGRLYVSVSDGTLWRLSAAGDNWEMAGASTPRLAHRLASDGERVLILGGADKGGNFDLVEAIDVQSE